MRVRFDGGILPSSTWGRIAAACGAVLLATAAFAALRLTRSFTLQDDHFSILSPSSIQIVGNAHLTRPQLLSVFGGDVERSVFAMPMAERRTELEHLPWVAHATVMRLLPNRVRVAIVERTPVAFARQGSKIDLVDAEGVLLDMAAPEAQERPGSAPQVIYSFPVLTGIRAGDPLSTRTARMKIYAAFLSALDASGESISRKLSEVDLSNPEDVKAILPEQGLDVLVHFGDERYLERYHRFEEHLPEWRAQYPKLASVDMRYERQVVLEMGASPATSPSAAADLPPSSSAPALTPRPAKDAAAAAKPLNLQPLSSKRLASPAKPQNEPLKPAAAALTPAPPVTSPPNPDAQPAVAKRSSVPAAPQHLTTAFPVTPPGAGSPRPAPARPAPARPAPARPAATGKSAATGEPAAPTAAKPTAAAPSTAPTAAPSTAPGPAVISKSNAARPGAVSRPSAASTQGVPR